MNLLKPKAKVSITDIDAPTGVWRVTEVTYSTWHLDPIEIGFSLMVGIATSVVAGYLDPIFAILWTLFWTLAFLVWPTPFIFKLFDRPIDEYRMERLTSE